MGPGSGEAIARLALAQKPAAGDRYEWTNVVLLDSALHAFSAALRQVTSGTINGSYIPATIGRVDYYSELPDEVWGQVKIFADDSSRAAVAQVKILSQDGDLVAEIVGLELRQATSLSGSSLNGRSGRSSQSDDPLLNQSRDEMIAALLPLNRSERVTNLSRWLIAEIKDVMGTGSRRIGTGKAAPECCVSGDWPGLFAGYGTSAPDSGKDEFPLPTHAGP